MDRRTSAWRAAFDAADIPGVRLVPLDGIAEAREVTEVIDAVWGEEVLDAALVHALQHAGNVLYGARSPDERLVGFVLGFLGWDEEVHVHSHMLAVIPEWQSRGVGFALKLAQRAASLDHGIGEVRWTFDPLVARNARFNLIKLGAVATRYLPNFYGQMRDRLNRGDRSDRFEVRWRLTSPRVERAISGLAEPPRLGLLLVAARGDPPTPHPTGESPSRGARIAVPEDHFRIRSADPELGRKWRSVAGQAFQECFDRGLVAVWMSNVGEYVFDAPEEE